MFLKQSCMHYGKHDLENVDRQIGTIKQEIEFERSASEHVSSRARYLLDDLKILHKQRAVVLFLMRQDS